MVKTTAMCIEELSDYASPANRLQKLVRDKKLFPIIRGLYETDRETAPYLLAACICGPSYISFDFALAFYGLIPELVREVTSATFGKRRQKIFETLFGRFSFRDVPEAAFPHGIELRREGDYFYRIACAEKALCDKIWTLPPVANRRELAELLFENLRIDETELKKFRKEKLAEIAAAYPSRNVKMLEKFLKKDLL